MLTWVWIILSEWQKGAMRSVTMQTEETRDETMFVWIDIENK